MRKICLKKKKFDLKIQNFTFINTKLKFFFEKKYFSFIEFKIKN